MATYTGSYVRYNEMTKVDYCKVESDTSISFTRALASMSTMKTYTILMATWDGMYATIEASYLSPDNDSEGATFTVYRKTPEDQYYTYIATLSNGEFMFKDHAVVANQFYHYLAAALTTDSLGHPVYKIYENYLEDPASTENSLVYHKTSFNTWSICDIEESNEEGVYIKTGDTWSLGYNINDEQVTQHIATSTWDTLGRYSKVSMGPRNYDSGTFSGLLGAIAKYTCYDMPELTRAVKGDDGSTVMMGYYEGDATHAPGWYNLTDSVFRANIKSEDSYTEKNTTYGVVDGCETWTVENPYAREVDKLIAWKKFMGDGKLKLLKDTKGNGWIVAITDMPSYNINVASINQLTNVSFSWQEIEDINSVSVIDIY